MVAIGLYTGAPPWVVLQMLLRQGGEDPQDALSCRSFFAKEPLIIGLFCGKWSLKIGHIMGLQHPVWQIPLQNLHPRNPPPWETRFSNSLVQILLEISIWICTVRYREIWVPPSGGFRGCSFFSAKCHSRCLPRRKDQQNHDQRYKCTHGNYVRIRRAFAAVTAGGWTKVAHPKKLKNSIVKSFVHRTNRFSSASRIGKPPNF